MTQPGTSGSGPRRNVVLRGIGGSPFIAVLQLVVYAGAIMVLFLFVLMLLNAKREEHPEGESGWLKYVAAALVLLLALQAGSVLVGAEAGRGAAAFDATTRKVALELFSARFLYVFEATSVLILAALVGAVALAKKDL